jgi:hypothetical protein
VFLLALSILSAIVWWRVLNRPNELTAGSTKGGATPSHAPCTPGVQSLPTAASVTLQVLNGSSREGLASSVRDALRARGFAVAGIGNEAKPVTGIGQIRYGRSAKGGATLLTFYVPGAKLMPTNRSDGRLDLVVGSGYQTVAAQTAAKKAIAAAAARNKPC